jgi:hypothetical protein
MLLSSILRFLHEKCLKTLHRFDNIKVFIWKNHSQPAGSLTMNARRASILKQGGFEA